MRRDVLNAPASSLLYDVTVSAVGVVPANKLIPQIIWDGDDDENGTEELEDLSVYAIPGTDQITYTLSHRNGFFSGPVKVQTLVA